MIYVIDHNDSFTHNVVHQFALFDKVECDNYDKVSENKIKQATTIIFSPGPGNPKNYPITSKIYKKYKGKKKIYHGFQSNVKVITNKSLFKKGKIFKVGRYHSLKLKEPFKSYNFEITMRCLNSKVAMAFENHKEKIYGFQFHPESFLTINGNLLIKKILSA